MSNKLKLSEIDATGAITDDVIKYDGSNFVVGAAPSGGGGGGWTLIEEKELLVNSATVDFIGLDTDADLSDTEGYIIDFINCKSAINTSSIIHLRFNADSATNYYQYNTDSSPAAQINTDVTLAASSADARFSRLAILNPKTAAVGKRAMLSLQYSVFFINANVLSTVSASPRIFNHWWNTNTNITQINILLSSGAIASGGIIRLYKGEIIGL